MSSLYKTRAGASPAIVARRHGISVHALMAANPHKPTTVVAGKHTWQGLGLGEDLRMPAGVGVGFVGDAAADAINAVIAAGGPCLQANAPLVCAAQRALGILADGEWGPGTSTAARKHVPSAPAGCATPQWWGAKGTNHCGGTSAKAPAPTAATAPPPLAAPSSKLTIAARTALTALSGDANYCTSVARTGTAVNTAVHNFKAAWNAANPGRAVPIGTGKYEIVTAAALWSALGGQVDVPPGCGAAATPAAAPTYVPPVAQIPAGSGGSAPQSGAPAAVQALAGINPCLQANSGTVLLAQTALGIVADGKYGPGTAAAARALGVSAPAACSPAPVWWGAKGTPAAAKATAVAKTAASSGTTPVGPSGTQCPEFSQYDAATGKCVPYKAEAQLTPGAIAAAAAAAAAAQARDAAAAAAAAGTKAAADAAAATAQAAIDAAARAAAAATTQAQTDAANLAAKVAADALAAANAKGGTAPGGGGITAPAETKGLSKGAIVAGAVGAAALVGLVAMAAMSKKPGHRGARGARGPSRRKKTSKRKSSKRKSKRK